MNYMKVWAVALLCMLGACSDEDNKATEPQGRGVVSLRFTRVTQQGPADEREQVKTLRVIMANEDNTEIVYNYSFDETEITDTDTEWHVTFYDIPAVDGGTTYNFYAIANESSFLQADESLEGKDAAVLNLICKCTLGKDYNTVSEEAIPQTVAMSHKVLPDEENIVPLQLKYAVAKVNLTFVNSSGEAQSVSYISISGIKGASAPLFAPASLTATGEAMAFTDVTVPASGSNVQTVYVYETASADGYTLTATYGGQLKTLILNDLTEIPRGMQVNITVTLKGGALYATWKVSEWDDRGMSYEMSDNGTFDLSATTVRKFDDSSLATVYSQSAGAADEQLTFTVRMTAPEGVRWIAHLTNPADFEFTGDYQGVGGEQAQPVTVTVRPTKAAATMDSRRETELYFTIDTNRDAEQNFNASPLGLGDNVQRVRIVQVTSAEWNNLQIP